MSDKAWTFAMVVFICATCSVISEQWRDYLKTVPRIQNVTLRAVVNDTGQSTTNVVVYGARP